MKRIFVQTLLLLLTLLITSPLLAHGTIVINNVEHSKGYIDVKIYDNKNSFLKEELAKETAKATEEISQKIESIQTETEGAVVAIGEITQVINRIADFQNTIAKNLIKSNLR